MTSTGVDAVASTSMMDSRDPVVRRTFADMVKTMNADAVLVTQLIAAETASTLKTMRPESTYNFRPTWYYNVWSVELTEYLEPPAVRFDSDVVLGTQLFSVAQQESVWGIESRFRFVQKVDHLRDYEVFVDQANSIVTHLSQDGLLTR